MMLLSPLALLFGLAAAVPLILHLYQRRQRTVILFSTNRFFTQSIIRSQRRLRLRRWLLLALRLATCVLFALALARPILGWAGLLGGGAGQRDVVIVLDDSLSMQAAAGSEHGGATVTSFDRARALAQGVLRGLAAGDRAAVLTFSGRAVGQSGRDAQFSSDIARLAEEVGLFQPAPAAGDAFGALQQAAGLVTGSSPRARSLLVLTDLQAADWGQGEWPQPPAPVPAVLAALPPPTRDNLVVDQAILSQGTAVVGQPNLLRVRLVNHRAQAAQAELVLQVDGGEVVRRLVDLVGQGPQIERIPLAFDSPGEHALQARLAGADALPADDALYATVRVAPRLPVLLLDGQSDQGREKSAVFYLQAALQAVGTDPQAESMPVKVIAPADLPAANLEAYRVIIACDVRDLDVAQVERLEDFVRAGGGLAILLGERADPTFYNDILGAPSRPLGGLLPADLRSRLGAAGAGEAMHIVEAQLDHPVLQRFKSTLRGALAGITIHQAHGLAPRGGWVLASMGDRWPLMVERGYGRGRVIIVATLPQPSWTDWPLRRAFLPLASSLVGYLAGGATLVADHQTCRDLVLNVPPGQVDRPVQVRRPDGSVLVASAQTSGSVPAAVVPAAMTDQPGIYRVEPASGQGPGEPLALNVPRRESDPLVLDAADLLRRAGRWQVGLVDLREDPAGQAGDLASALAAGPGSAAVWDTLLWIVLAIAVLEPVVANRDPGGRAGPAVQKRGIGATPRSEAA